MDLRDGIARLLDKLRQSMSNGYGAMLAARAADGDHPSSLYSGSRKVSMSSIRLINSLV